jgi:peroxiredoxin
MALVMRCARCAAGPGRPRGATLPAPRHPAPALGRRRLLALGGAAILAARAGPARAADPFEALAVRRFPQPHEPRDFTAATRAGGRLTLGDFHGRVVLVNFWATWCPPCVTELPALERLHRRHEHQGFTVLALSMDTGAPAMVDAFVRERGLSFPVGLDPAGEIARRYGVRALPTTVLLDRHGRAVASAIGPREWDGPDAHALVEALLRTR